MPCPFQQVGVGGEVGKTQQGGTRLPGTQKFTGAANLQVATGDFETVMGISHRTQALAATCK